MLEIQPGDVLLGKYRVERFLGRGGMGDVVAARHIDLDELFAIKLLRPRLGSERPLVQRFIREARAAAKLRTPHATQVYDVGKLDDGTPYMVMEHLEGSDLRGVFMRHGPLPPGHVARLVIQACEGIAAAHALGIVHRDLKLANLFLARQGDAEPLLKVLDFGISKHANAEEILTHPGALIGSPRYMSPEQFRDPRDVDPRSDVWGLGVIFYQLVTGKVPFAGRSVTTLLANVLNETPPSPSVVRKELPATIDGLIARCLAKDRNERFATVDALATAIDRLELDAGGSLRAYLEAPPDGDEDEDEDETGTETETMSGREVQRSSELSVTKVGSQSGASAGAGDEHDRAQLSSSLALGLPGGIVRASSYWYVTRGQLEQDCMTAITEPGALVHIEGPWRVGKTSLMRRVLDHARDAGMRVVHVDLLALDDDLGLDPSMRWLCSVVGRQLGQPRVTEQWDPSLDSRQNATVVFEDRFLDHDTPLVLALNHLERVFDNDDVADVLLTMLRSWHEMAEHRPPWDQLSLLLVHSTAMYRPMDPRHSPFEVGFVAKLEDWSAATILELATRHGLDWGEGEVERVRRLLGGHPHLIRVALHHLANHDRDLDELLADATSERSPFASHLAQTLAELRERPALAAAALELATAAEPVVLEPEITAKLVGLGVARSEADAAAPRSELYRRYLATRLGSAA